MHEIAVVVEPAYRFAEFVYTKPYMNFCSVIPQKQLNEANGS